MSGECHKHTPDQAIQLSVFPVRSGPVWRVTCRVNAGFVLKLMLNWRYMHWSVGKPE